MPSIYDWGLLFLILFIVILDLKEIFDTKKKD